MRPHAIALIPEKLQPAIIREPLAGAPDLPVRAAIAQMHQARSPQRSQTATAAPNAHERASCVLVVDQGHLVGLLTEADVVRLNAELESLNGWTLGQVMSPLVATLAAAAFTDEAVAWSLLQQFNIRHLPILDEQKQVVGLVTQSSLQAAIALLPTPAPRAQPVTQITEPGEALLPPTLIAMMPVGVFRTDAAGRCTYVNDCWQQITGLTLAEALGDGWAQAIHPEDRASVIAEWTHSTQKNRPFRLEYRFQNREGRVAWVYGQATAERNAAGQIIGFVGTITDISDRKAVEQALQVQRDFNRLIAEITTRFVDLDAERLDAEINRTLEILGTATQTDTSYLIKFSVPDPGAENCTLSMTHEWCRPGYPAQIDQVQGIPGPAFPWSLTQIGQRQTIQVPDVENLPPEAAIDQANWRAFNLRSLLTIPLIQQSQVVGMMGFASFSQPRSWDDRMVRLLQVMGQAIASAQERIQAEYDLYVSEERLRLALGAAKQGLYDLNLQTGEAVTNAEYAEMLGYDPATFRESQTQWLDRLHPDDLEPVQAILTAYLAGDLPEYRVEFRQRTSSGIYKWILSIGKIVTWDAAGTPLRLLGTHIDVSDRKQAELERLQARQTLYELLLLEKILDVILVGYWDWDIPNHQEYLSPGFKRMFGYADHELPNAPPETWQNLIFQEDLPRVLDCFERHVQSHGQEPYHNEIRYHHKDGSTIWVLCSGQVIEWDEAGNPLRMIGCHIDITAQKQTEADLRQAKEELENFFMVALDLLCIADTSGRFHRVNRAWETTLGYTITELEGRAFLDFVHPDDMETTLAAIATLEEQNAIQGFVNRYRCRDGSYRYIEWYSRPYGQLIYAAARDITKQRQFEQQLQKSETHLKTAQRIGKIGSWAFDVQTGEITWSDEVFRIFWRDPASGPPTYAELLQLYIPEDQHYHDQVVQQAIQTGQPYDLECRGYHPDGSLFYVQARGEPMFNAAGQLVQLVGTVLDITDRKQTEEQLRHLTTRLTLALQAGAIGTWDWDIEHNILTWDDRMYELYAVAQTELPLTYETWLSALYPDDCRKAKAAVDQALRGEHSYNSEFRIQHPDGSIRYLKGYALVQHNAQGEPRRMVGIDYDITALKQTENSLRQASAQLEASNRELEAFAYSVSHDLRAPLRAIDGFSRALLEDYGDRVDEDGQEYFDRIRHNVKRMGMLIDDLLRLSRVSRSTIEYTTVDLSALVQEQIDELRTLDPDRQVEVVIAPEVVVSADATLMQAVIGNLIQNAWKFTSHHPTARIEFRTTQIDGHTTYFIQDDGAGFNMTYAEMLFGVFQRLHNTDEFPGTGIGLATVQRAIARHGGRIWAEGEVEQGATFYFTLPDG